jgi:hypothetical protein
VHVQGTVHRLQGVEVLAQLAPPALAIGGAAAPGGAACAADPNHP